MHADECPGTDSQMQRALIIAPSGCRTWSGGLMPAMPCQPLLPASTLPSQTLQPSAQRLPLSLGATFQLL